MDLDSVEELAGYVAAEGNHATDKKHQRGMDSIWRKLEYILETYSDEEPREATLEDPSELEQRNHRPIPDGPTPYPGGLSLWQAGMLICSDWDSPDSLIRINGGLNSELLEESQIWVNSRLFLQALRERKSLEATATGNLSRKSVADLLGAMQIPQEVLESIYRYNKVINETDVWMIHIVRVLLGIAKLIRREKRNFQLTRKGAEMLKEERAGALFAILFKTHFRKFNLAYLDQMEENPTLQGTAGFTLYRISEVFERWRQLDHETAEGILIPEAISAAADRFSTDYILWQTESRILRPLVSFGLLHERKTVKEGRRLPVSEYRLTPLYGRFLEFRLP